MMNVEALEARLSSLEGQVREVEKLKSEVANLEKRLEDRELQLQTIQDIEDIKRLQCAYGYYLEHGMGQEIIDCFSNNPEVSGTFAEGTYNGPEGIRRYFGHPPEEISPEYHHMIMQVSPVITVAPDRNRAWGRWYGYGTVLFGFSIPLNPMYTHVIYEMEYIKEDGIWKILKLQLLMNYAYTQGGVPFVNTPDMSKLNPDVWGEFDNMYPSGYIYPFHYKHPVTGKETSEAKRNATLKLKPNRFRTQ